MFYVIVNCDKILPLLLAIANGLPTSNKPIRMFHILRRYSHHGTRGYLKAIPWNPIRTDSVVRWMFEKSFDGYSYYISAFVDSELYVRIKNMKKKMRRKQRRKES